MDAATVKKEFALNSKHNNRLFGCDVTYLDNGQAKPIVIFVHGFKGFKDWGPFNLIAGDFALQGYVFIKINLSHNGTTTAFPQDFVDLEAFGNNNISIELDDIGVLIDHIYSNESQLPFNEIDLNKIFLIGHSRGGGLVLLKAAEDNRVKAVVTWAAVSTFDKHWEDEEIEEWKSTGVQWIYNSRTKQNMPLYFQYFENYKQNEKRLDIKSALHKLKVPCLFIHGDKDETVHVTMAKELKAFKPDSELKVINGANHTFGVSHPFTEDGISMYLKDVLNTTLKFFLKN